MELMTKEKKGQIRTEFGTIPEDWNYEPLENFFSYISYGFTNPMPTTEKGVYMITAADISNGEIQYEGARHTSKWAFDSLLTQKSRPQIDDILLTKDGTLGRVALVDRKNICINQSVAVIRPNDRIEPLFLKYLLEGPEYQKIMIQNAGGSTIKHLYITKVNLMEIGVPSKKEEQQAIASALSDVDELIRSLDGLIQKKQAIKKGTMQQLLTPNKSGQASKKRLPGFDGEWEVKKLGECFDFLKTGTQSRRDLNSHGDVGYIHYGDIHSKWDLFLDCDNQAVPKIDIGKVKSLPKLQEGDLIIADASEDYEGVGKSIEIKNIGERNIVAGLHTMLLRAKNESIADGFKAYITSIESVKRKLAQIATGTTVYGLSKTKLKELEVLLPKSIEEQKAIAQILSDMDRELQTLRQKREKYVQIKQGMMQELLMGRVRLIAD